MAHETDDGASAAATASASASQRLKLQTNLGKAIMWSRGANLVEALNIYDPERDRKARFRFGPDTGASARAHLAITMWQLGEVGPARTLIEEAVAYAIETGHLPTLILTYVFEAHFEIVRGDAGAARRGAEIVVELSQENALMLFAATGGLETAARVHDG
jgi:hypothetical protein